MVATGQSRANFEVRDSRRRQFAGRSQNSGVEESKEAQQGQETRVGQAADGQPWRQHEDAPHLVAHQPVKLLQDTRPEPEHLVDAARVHPRAAAGVVP